MNIKKIIHLKQKLSVDVALATRQHAGFQPSSKQLVLHASAGYLKLA